MLLGLLAAVFVGVERHNIEMNNKTIELAIDYEDVAGLALMEGVNQDKLMADFKTAGITSLAIYDSTLEKLHKTGLLNVYQGSDVKLVLNEVYQTFPIEANKVYVVKGPTQSSELFDEVKQDLIRRLSMNRVQEYTGASYEVLAVDALYEKVIKWNLGLPSYQMKDAAKHGLYVIARPTNFTKVDSDDVESVFKRIPEGVTVSSMMFVGDEVLGFPKLIGETADNMKKRNITLALIEHPTQLQFLKQDGLIELAEKNNYNASRMYVIPKDEQLKMKIDQAVNRFNLTDEERNIRINLLRIFEKPEGMRTILETNLEYVEKVKNSLVNEGFTIGRAGTFIPFFPAKILLALMILGATSAGVLFLSLVYPLKAKYQYIILSILGILLIIPLLLGKTTLVRQAAALASANLFPVLAMTYQLDKWQEYKLLGLSLGQTIIKATKGLIITTLLSLTGGIYVASLLGDVRFFLEIDIFRGVKLTFILPLILISIIYITRYDLFGAKLKSLQDCINAGKEVLNYPIKVWSIIGIGFIAFAAYIFIGRSGHTAGVPVPAIELKFRAFLEQVLPVRPRSKEFLIGHPAFFMAVYALSNKWPIALHYLLVVGATIGQSSLVETFAHVRTPELMSIIRAFDGLAIGLVVGILALIILNVIEALVERVGRRIVSND